VDVEGFYAEAAARGVEYGPAFRGIAGLWRGSDEAVARLAGGRLTMVLDAVLQTAGAVLHDEAPAFLPVAIERVVWSGAAAWAHARLAGREGG
jgi:hypothetical protein